MTGCGVQYTLSIIAGEIVRTWWKIQFISLMNITYLVRTTTHCYGWHQYLKYIRVYQQLHNSSYMSSGFFGVGWSNNILTKQCSAAIVNKFVENTQWTSSLIAVFSSMSSNVQPSPKWRNGPRISNDNSDAAILAPLQDPFHHQQNLSFFLIDLAIDKIVCMVIRFVSETLLLHVYPFHYYLKYSKETRWFLLVSLYIDYYHHPYIVE